MSDDTMTAKEMAEAIGTDGKTFRRCVRSLFKAAGGSVGTDTPGRGRRYAFKASETDVWQARFDAWRKGPNVMLVSFADLISDIDVEPSEDVDAS